MVDFHRPGHKCALRNSLEVGSCLYTSATMNMITFCVIVKLNTRSKSYMLYYVLNWNF